MNFRSKSERSARKMACNDACEKEFYWSSGVTQNESRTIFYTLKSI